MAGDPFGLLLRQRIVFLGGEASIHRAISCPSDMNVEWKDLTMNETGTAGDVLTRWLWCRSMTLQQMRSSASCCFWIPRTLTRYNTWRDV